MKVSTLVLTQNEAANLPRCLGALFWCDDILVVDSGSTDNTVEIAEKFGARVLVRPFDDFALQRNFGLEEGKLRHEWVLHLDADEVVTDAFIKHLVTLEPLPDVHGYRIPSKIMFGDKWLRRAGMYPTYQVRLGRRDRLRFILVGHGQRETLAPENLETFDEPYLHYSISHGLKRWFEKHVTYAAAEARELALTRAERKLRWRDFLCRNKMVRRRAAKSLSNHLPLYFRPFGRFFYVFFWRRGFLDGVAGFKYACMLSIYEGMIALLGSSSEPISHKVATLAEEQCQAGRTKAMRSQVQSSSRVYR
jgi:glycosyltransferase involved in cell wall biosynthesis